ncbi:DUF2851 family protein [bacterium]|nr:DUF2851 family protein [bacterium]
MAVKGLAERFICHIWDGNHIKKRNLYTQSGKRISIKFPGNWNTFAGPDFRNAIIKLDHEELSGDVEVHLHSSHWYSHQHHLDPNYNRVILHVVMWGNDTPYTNKENNQRVEILELHKILDRSIDKLFTEYKLEDMKVQTKNCPFIPKEKRLLAILEECGEIRFLEKVERFRKLTQNVSYEQALYQGILEALGYSKNSMPFSLLAERLPVEAIRYHIANYTLRERIFRTQALLLGMGGLLPSQNIQTVLDLPQKDMTFISSLEKTWANIDPRYQRKHLNRSDWKFFRIRPDNFPTRRIAGISHILGKHINKGVLNALINAFFQSTPEKDTLAEFFIKLYYDDYWCSHYDFSGKTQPPRTNLIGNDRARTIVVNIALPVIFLFFDSEKNVKEANNVLKYYVSYAPLPDNNITRLLKQRIFSSVAEGNKYIDSVSRQQGLLYLYKKYCYCGDCTNCVITS